MTCNKLIILFFTSLFALSVRATDDITDLIQQVEQGEIEAQYEITNYYRNKQDYTNLFKWTKNLQSKDMTSFTSI